MSGQAYTMGIAIIEDEEMFRAWAEKEEMKISDPGQQLDRKPASQRNSSRQLCAVRKGHSRRLGRLGQ